MMRALMASGEGGAREAVVVGGGDIVKKDCSLEMVGPVSEYRGGSSRGSRGETSSGNILVGGKEMVVVMK